MKLLIEIEIQDNDQIEEGSDWPPFLERYKILYDGMFSKQLPQQVKSVKLFNHPINQELGDMQRVAYKWNIFSSPALTLNLVQEEI